MDQRRPPAPKRKKKQQSYKVPVLIFCAVLLAVSLTQVFALRACRGASGAGDTSAAATTAAPDTAPATDDTAAPVTADTAPPAASDTTSAPPAVSDTTSAPPASDTTTVPAEAPERVIDPAKPIIALTFDDGPCADSNRLLDILEANGAVATFFEQGRNVERYPDVVKRELALGCELGNHTYGHQRLTELSKDAKRAQIVDANNAFINAVGVAPKLLRPPYGKYDSEVRELSGELDMYIILWSVDTLDWKLKDADKTYESVMSQAYDGALLLLHSVHPTTVDAAERFIPDLAAQGYQFVTVSELAALRGVTMETGVGYGKFRPAE